MKVELLFPPLVSPFGSVYLALPLLTGFLRKKGINVSQRDINRELFEELLTSEQIQTAQLDVECALEKITGTTSDHEKKLSRLTMVKALADVVIDLVEPAKKSLKTETDIYSSQKSYWILEYAGRILAAPYFPLEISLMGSRYDSIHTGEALTLENVCKGVYDKNENMFFRLFQNQTLPTLMHERDLVGISLVFPSQLIPGLTLAKVIKDSNDVIIVIGGPVLPYMEDAFFEYPEIFDIIDFAVVGDGEPALYNLITQLEGKRKFHQVPNILYRSEEGKITKSGVRAEVNPEEFSLPDFSDYNLEAYLTKDIVLPYLTARGCYWNKCAFCSVNSTYGSHYRPLDVTRVAEQLDELSHKYGAHYFQFVDSVVHPHRMRELSKEIIKHDLTIFWYVLARLEEEFSEAVLQLAYEAGCRIISWGLESGCQDTLDRMKKGISARKASSILKKTHEAGIWNKVFIIVGFIGETEGEFEQTLDFVTNNSQYIDLLASTIFRLQKNSAIFQNPLKYGIRIMEYPPSYLGLTYEYSTERGYESQRKWARFQIFDNRTMELHCSLQNIRIVDETRILSYLSENNKLEIRESQLKEAKNNIQAFEVANNLDLYRFSLKKDITWKGPFRFSPSDGSCHLSGYEPRSGKILFVSETLVHELEEFKTLSEIEKVMSSIQGQNSEGGRKRTRQMIETLVKSRFLNFQKI